MARKKEMENWKRGLLAGAAGLSVIFLLRGNRTGALLFGGVTLAALAHLHRRQERLESLAERALKRHG